MVDPTQPLTPSPPNWKIILAAILDFVLAFLVFGTIIAKLTGDTNESGWNLSGIPALVLLVLIVAYFVVGNRFFRGTLFKHVFGTAKAR